MLLLRVFSCTCAIVSPSCAVKAASPCFQQRVLLACRMMHAIFSKVDHSKQLPCSLLKSPTALAVKPC